MKFAKLRWMTAAASILVALTQVGCGGGGGGGGASGGQQQPGPQPAATAVGTLIGEPSSAIVGTEGGTVTSADGKVTITVPAGAVPTSTTITIQTVTNHAHGGAGSAYQLLPEGQTFAKPVTLSFNYSDADVAGSAESALGVAFQRSNGIWEWVDPQVDTVAKKVTAQTTHFSHWSMVHGFRLFPHQATVGTGKTVALKVAYCYTEPVGDLVALGFACKENDPELPWLEGYVNDWSVDGVLGGNSTKGTVTGEDFNATFTAPSTVPTPDTVAVSARVRAPRSTEMTLIVANVKIIESTDYSGTVNFQNGYASGTANISWKKMPDVGQGAPEYQVSGSMQITTHVEGCDSRQLSFAVGPTDPTSSNNTLVVYPDGTYYFHLDSNQPENVTLMCGTNPKAPMDFPTAMFTSVAVGSSGCPNPPPTYSDVRHLAGTWTCAAGMEATTTWDFRAP